MPAWTAAGADVRGSCARCGRGGGSLPAVMFPTGYNNNVQILQAPG
ncbi:MAG TPA: hypothetical protein VI485_14365 [Vicinamibacterales bacterium]|nr:hypothetical protein [Vicinamibacterales bacterium]